MVRPTDIVGRFTVASIPSGFAAPSGIRTNAGQFTQPPPAASRIAKKEIPFWGNTTHIPKIPARLDRSKPRTTSEEEFVFDL